MSSKTVTDRQKSAEFVIATGGTHAGLIGEEVAKIVKPFAKKGTPVPDMEVFVGLLSEALQAARDEMVRADEAHERELADDVESRSKRDALALEMRAYLLESREIAAGLYGEKVCVELGFNRPTPQDPVVLHRFAGEIASGLEKATLPKPRIKGAQWNAAEVAKEIQTRRGQLEGYLQSVAKEVKEAQVTLEAKNRAVERYDRVFSGVATSLSALLGLAGKGELAQKVRPTARGAWKTTEEAEGDAAPAPVVTNS